MNKPTDDEAAARRVLARKLCMAYAEHARTLESLASMKHPAIDDVRSVVETASDDVDELLWKYDRDYGAPNERATTKLQLRMLNAKMCRTDYLQSQQLLRYSAHIAGLAPFVEACNCLIAELYALCKANGVPIPPELMGPPR